MVVFPFAFHIAVQQPFKPLWSRLLLYELEPPRASFALCFKSLLMTLLPALGTSDPYVKFKVGGQLLYKSKTIYRDLNPIWDESFTLPIEDPFMPVHIKSITQGERVASGSAAPSDPVFDYDWVLQDDFMGSAFLDLTKLELGKSPDLTPCDFFLWGYIKDRVYVPQLVELKERIDATVMTTDRMKLQNVWNELDYRLDVCRVTQGAYIEHL
ncbi:hypothetical protein B7P43_G13065 [Cryptotermes secundus]|uniref:C2 domain-containing protein n=1 Tax=Cryptotermes secundus TaxID=105785 RepID=A0A2J7QM92_9NEOP|nr:hypothetical protein B7P43_G13065 [Cryptotermes secundus]